MNSESELLGFPKDLFQFYVRAYSLYMIIWIVLWRSAYVFSMIFSLLLGLLCPFSTILKWLRPEVCNCVTGLFRHSHVVWILTFRVIPKNHSMLQNSASKGFYCLKYLYTKYTWICLFFFLFSFAFNVFFCCCCFYFFILFHFWFCFFFFFFNCFFCFYFLFFLFLLFVLVIVKKFIFSERIVGQSACICIRGFLLYCSLAL